MASRKWTSKEYLQMPQLQVCTNIHFTLAMNTACYTSQLHVNKIFSFRMTIAGDWLRQHVSPGAGRIWRFDQENSFEQQKVSVSIKHPVELTISMGKIRVGDARLNQAKEDTHCFLIFRRRGRIPTRTYA